MGVVSTDLAGGWVSVFRFRFSAGPIHPFSKCSAVNSSRLRPRTRSRPQSPHEHGASYPTPTRAASTRKKGHVWTAGQIPHFMGSSVSAESVFAEGSFFSGGGARTEGQLPPFRVARRFTPRRCLISRASYPLPRGRQYRPRGRLIQFPVQFQWGQSTPSIHGAQNAQERRTLKRTRTQNQNRIVISARYMGQLLQFRSSR